MPATGWPFITSVFSFLSLAKKKWLYYYVKLCLWKHKSAPLLCSPSPGKHDSTSHFSAVSERQFFYWSQVCTHVLPDSVSGQNSPHQIITSSKSSPIAEINMRQLWPAMLCLFLRYSDLRIEVEKYAKKHLRWNLEILTWRNISFCFLWGCNKKKIKIIYRDSASFWKRYPSETWHGTNCIYLH